MPEGKLWRDKLHIATVAVVLFLTLFFWFSPGHREKLDMTYLWPMTIAVMAVTLSQERTPPHRCVLVALALTGWFWLTCALNGDPYLILNGRFLLGVALTFGVAWPVFLTTNKRLCSGGLKALAALYVLLMLVVALLSLYAAITGTEICTPLNEQTLGIRNGRLYAFAYHPNEVGSALSVGLALALWLCFAVKCRVKRLLCVLAAVITFLTISLTASYTVMITVSFALGLGAMIIAARFVRVKPRLRKAAACCLVALCVAVITFLCFTPALNLIQWAGECVAQSRAVAETAEQSTDQPTNTVFATGEITPVDVVGDLSTLYSRFAIWENGLAFLRERPVTLLIGALDSDVAWVNIRFYGEQVFHMHNLWMEMLLLAGVPGLLMYLWLCMATLRGCVLLALAPGVPLCQRLLAVLPPMLMLNGLMEIYPGVSGNVMDMMYAVICGAVIRLGNEATGSGAASARGLVRSWVCGNHGLR